MALDWLALVTDPATDRSAASGEAASFGSAGPPTTLTATAGAADPFDKNHISPPPTNNGNLW